MEMLIVLTIIALLMGMVIFQVSDLSGGAKREKAQTDLLDDGFLTGENASTSYVGWRNGSFYVPVSLLKAGVNTVQFSEEDDAALTLGTDSASDAGVAPPLAIKAMVMQLNYLSAQASTGISQPQLSMPAGPVPPPESSTTPSETNAP